MKLNYKIKLIASAIVLSVSIGHANASQIANLSTTSIVQNSGSWEVVQNQKGINISFAQVAIEGKTYLKIKFENTTNQLIDFTWSLNKKDEQIVNETSNKIKTNGFVETDHNQLISFNNGDSYADFSFNIQVK